MVFSWNKHWIGLFALCMMIACRTSREKVEVLSTETRAKVGGDPNDGSNVPASMRSSLLLSDVSMPAGSQPYKKLIVDVTLVEKEADSTATSYENYLVGTGLPLVALKEYRVDVKALNDGDIVLAESRHCVKPFKFRAQFGQNKFTAKLCAGPTTN